MIGYRPGRKSKMIERTTVLVSSNVIEKRLYSFTIYENFTEFINRQRCNYKAVLPQTALEEL